MKFYTNSILYLRNEVNTFKVTMLPTLINGKMIDKIKFMFLVLYVIFCFLDE